MVRRLALLGLAIGWLAGSGCVSKVWMPPRLDLHRHGTLGLVEFQSYDGHGATATQRFLANVHAAQAGVPVLELGPLPAVLRTVGHEAMGPAAARAIGERYGVDALLIGDLVVVLPRPSFSVRSLTRAEASAEILGTLSTRLVDAHSGATVWSDEARGKRTVAHVGLSAQRPPRIGASDPESEHEQLVAWLVDRVTNDFRGHWVRQ